MKYFIFFCVVVMLLWLVRRQGTTSIMSKLTSISMKKPRQEILYGLVGAVFITFVLVFIKFTSPEWSAHWDRHGIDLYWFYLFAGMWAMIYVITDSGSKFRLFCLTVLLLVGGLTIVWHASSTTYHYAYGSPEQIAAQNAAEKERKAAAAQGGKNALAGIFEYFSHCNFKKEPFEFTPSWKSFPGQCKTDYWLEAGECVEYKETPDGPTLGPYGYCREANGATAPPKPIKALYARAYNGKTFTHDVTVSQPPSKH